MNNDEILRYPIGKFISKPDYSSAELQYFIEKLERLPWEVEKMVKELTPQQLDMPYRLGGWTARQVVHHLADSHTNAYIRTKWTLTEETPTIKAYDEKMWAETPEKSLDPIFSIELLKAMHGKWTELLKRLKPLDFKREFLHPETGSKIRMDSNIAQYAWHGEHHCGHLAIVANTR